MDSVVHVMRAMEPRLWTGLATYVGYPTATLVTVNETGSLSVEFHFTVSKVSPCLVGEI